MEVTISHKVNIGSVLQWLGRWLFVPVFGTGTAGVVLPLGSSTNRDADATIAIKVVSDSMMTLAELRAGVSEDPKAQGLIEELTTRLSVNIDAYSRGRQSADQLAAQRRTFLVVLLVGIALLALRLFVPAEQAAPPGLTYLTVILAAVLQEKKPEIGDLAQAFGVKEGDLKDKVVEVLDKPIFTRKLQLNEYGTLSAVVTSAIKGRKVALKEIADGRRVTVDDAKMVLRKAIG